MKFALTLILINILLIGEASGQHLVQTRPYLKVSVRGEGCFLKLARGDHQRYIRSALLKLNNDHEFVDSQGYKIGIRLPRQATHLDISRSGTVMAYLDNDLAKEVKINYLTVYKTSQEKKCEVNQGELFAKL